MAARSVAHPARADRHLAPQGRSGGFPERRLAALIDRLAEEAPLYRLPAAIHAHTRHYMPWFKKGPDDRTLIFDAFARLDPAEPLIVAWPDTTLAPDERALALHLVERVGYLGRAESWVECEALAAWEEEPNCRPTAVGEAANRRPGGMPEATGDPVRVIASLTAQAYATERARLLAEFDARERKRLESGDRPPTRRADARALAKARDKAFGPVGADGAPTTSRNGSLTR